MTPQACVGLALGALLGGIYGVLQAKSLGRGPQPDNAGRSLAGSAVRLVVLMLAIFALLRWTNADRLFLVVGIMISYGLMFVIMMWRVLWKKSGK